MSELQPVSRSLPPDFKLSRGSHSSFERGACAMEAVAYIAGEPHSDHPQCASPVLTDYCIRLNDRWNDDERQLLLAVIPKLVGTRGDLDLHRKQAFILVDASIREITPLALEARKWDDLAARLRELAPIVDRDSARAARTVCEEVRSEAWKWKRRAAAATAAAAAATAADAYAYAYAYAAATADAAAAADAAVAAAADAAVAAGAVVAAVAAGHPIVLASIAALERAAALKGNQ